MRNAWGRVAVAYDELWTERTAPLTARGLDLLAPAPDWDGCDIGCGPGLTSGALAERLSEGRTLGLDFAEPMIARARTRFARPGLSFRGLRAPLSPGSALGSGFWTVSSMPTAACCGIVCASGR
jgi:trans-aconitate methyltransferase